MNSRGPVLATGSFVGIWTALKLNRLNEPHVALSLTISFHVPDILLSIKAYILTGWSPMISEDVKLIAIICWTYLDARP